MTFVTRNGTSLTSSFRSAHTMEGLELDISLTAVGRCALNWQRWSESGGFLFDLDSALFSTTADHEPSDTSLIVPRHHCSAPVSQTDIDTTPAGTDQTLHNSARSGSMAPWVMSHAHCLDLDWAICSHRLLVQTAKPC